MISSDRLVFCVTHWHSLCSVTQSGLRAHNSIELLPFGMRTQCGVVIIQHSQVV